jgi:hypothetical protein
MTPVASQARWMVVGTFSSLERLENAVAGLIAAAIGLNRMVLICTKRRLQEISAARAPTELSHLHELIRDQSRVGTLENGVSLPRDSPVVADLDVRAESSGSGLFHDLDETDEAAPALLLVGGSSHHELLQVTRVLLAHSSLSVRTREHVARLPRSGG